MARRWYESKTQLIVSCRYSVLSIGITINLHIRIGIKTLNDNR